MNPLTLLPVLVLGRGSGGPPFGLKNVDHDDENRDGNYDQPHHRNHRPRPGAEELVNSFLDPMQQFRIGGATLMGEDETDERGHGGVLIPGCGRRDRSLVARREFTLPDAEGRKGGREQERPSHGEGQSV